MRYKHLNRYERLRELPLEKDSGKDLDPDEKLNLESQEKEGFHSYLDEFLQAIRIFGYLEKPVFHELARHLQTRRLIAGDSLSLDSDFSFYIVIDGNVQVFAPLPENANREKIGGQEGIHQSRRGEESHINDSSSDEYNGFQLINEVGSGGTLSSLFTILSLFTEDVQLSKDSDHDENNQLSSNSNLGGGSVHHASRSSLTSSSPFLNPSQTPITSSSSSNPQSSFPLNEEALKQVPNAIGSKGSVLERLNPESTKAAVENEMENESNTEGSITVLDDKEHSFNRLGGLTPLEGQFSQDLASSGGQGEGEGSSSTSQSVVEDEGLRMPEARASAPFPNFRPKLTSSNSNSRDSSNSPIRGREGGQVTPPRNLNKLPSGFQPPPSSNPSQSNFPGTPLSQSQFSHYSSSQTGGAASHPHVSRPSDSLHPSVQSTVARATQDTTLAVIPAEAFKRLTKKFPNAAAHIVQVILTRLSRVTLHTAHEYLGLTKEVMKSEENLNLNNRFMLEKEFYQGGGMERLRLRFGGNLEVPTFGSGDKDQSSIPKEEEQDYFRNGRDGYLDSEDPGSSLRRRRNRKERDSTITQFDSPIRRSSNSTSTSTNTSASTSPSSAFFNKTSGKSTSHSSWSNREGTINFGDLNLKTPRARTSVGPGDLLSMTGDNENQNSSTATNMNGSSNSSNPHVTLKTPRPRSRVSNPFAFKNLDEGDSNSEKTKVKGLPSTSRIEENDIEEEDEDQEDHISNGRVKSWTSLGIENFDLRDSVMNCIARSIGLLAAPNAIQNLGPNGTGSSLQASPYINPSDHSLNRGIFNSAFSSLSMLDVAGNHHDDDDISSINGGTNTNSSINGINGQSNLLEKFENEIEIKFYKKGEVLINEGSNGEGLFYVIDGFLEVGLPIKEDVLKQKSKVNDRSSSANKKASKAKKSNGRDDDEDEQRQFSSRFNQDSSKTGLRNFQQEGNGRISRGKLDDNTRSNSSRKPSSAGGGRVSPIHQVSPSQQFGNALDGTRPIRKVDNTTSNLVSSPSNYTNDAQNNQGPNPRFKNSKGDSQAPPPHPDEERTSSGNNNHPNGNGMGNNSSPIYTVGRGGITGYLSSLLGKPSYVQVKAKTDCYVGVLPAHSLERMMEKRPIVLLTLCKRLLSLLSPLSE